MSEELTLYEKIIDVQKRLKAPKTLRNAYAEFNYRSAEGIEAAVKPLLFEHGLLMVISDDFVALEDQVDPGHVKATVTITDGRNSVETSAFARETKERKKSDSSQLTGAASSYARKYALCGMFLIDDTKDADSYEQEVQAPPTPKEQPTGLVNEKAIRIVVKQIKDMNFDDKQKELFKMWLGDHKISLGKYDEKTDSYTDWNIRDEDLEKIYVRLSELSEPIE